MTVSQSDKANQFLALHEAPDAFVVANVWDGQQGRQCDRTCASAA
jgi:2-methylisocitrate lyase-like PEP mutase family enzyme